MVPRGRVAVVGSGIAGLACAHLLDPIHDVVLYEADDRLGGHTNTVTVDDPTAGPLGVDTGFIVHNDRNYPNLLRLFGELGVATIDSEMSFAVTDRSSGLTYRATNPNTLFADRRNLLDRRMWRMVIDIVRFHRAGQRFLADPLPDPHLTLAEFLDEGSYSTEFVDLHLIPMGAAVWSADPTTFDRFPALSFLRFLDNHGLLRIGDRPQWRTVAGGSRSYIEAIVERFDGEIRVATPVTAVERTAGPGVAVTTPTGTERYDHVVLATHSDQALDLLADPTPTEKELLGAIGYRPNRATLHTDTSLLPPRRRAWAAWNYELVGPPGQHQTAPVLTYDLTTLQRLPGSRRYLVSLNSDDRIDPTTVIASFDYAHPVFDRRAVEAQGRLGEIDGVLDTWFCGAWRGYGFHEDGMVAALGVARSLGALW